jgi:hypothetical protein
LMKLQNVELIGLELEAVESHLHTEGLSLGIGECVVGDFLNTIVGPSLSMLKYLDMS